MLICYLILLSLLILILIVEFFCICGIGPLFYKYKNKILHVCSVTSELLLCAISVIGCIEIINNYINFLLTGIAIYFFLKDVFCCVVTNQREKSIQTKLQCYLESNKNFNELFVYCFSKEEKKTIANCWITTPESDDKKIIGILFNNERHYFKLRYKKHVNSIHYVINQIYDSAKSIKTKNDLANLQLSVVKDPKLAENYVNNFIPHNGKSIKDPYANYDALFNMCILAIYLIVNTLWILIHPWSSVSWNTKICIIVYSVMFAALAIAALISLTFNIYKFLKKTKK